MNNFEIEEYLDADVYTKKYFKGVLAYDELPLIQFSSGLFVVNTDTAVGLGKHWVVVFINDWCEYFDSLGNPPKELLPFLKAQNKPYIYSNKKLQGDDTNVCGDYCILYSYYRCRGISLESFLEKFVEFSEINDERAKL